MQLYKSILFSLLLFTCPQFGVLAQSEVPTSTESLFAKRPNSSGFERANIDLQLARYHFTKDTDSLLYYISFVEDYLKNNYDKRLDAFVQKFKGYEANLRLDTDKSIELVRESFLLFQELEDFREMGWLSLYLGQTYFRRGNLVSATEYILKSIEYFENVDHKKGLAESYNNLGRVSYQSRQFEKAEEHFNNAFAIYVELEDEESKYKIYNNLGLIQIEKDNIEAALEKFTRAAKGFKAINNQGTLAIVYGNISICYDELNQFDKAINYAYKAVNISEKLNNKYGIIVGNINLGYFHRLQESYDSSFICFEKALRIAIEGKVLSLEQAAYREYEELYRDLGDYKNAYTYNLKYDSLARKITDSESLKKIEELNFNYKHTLEERELLSLRMHKRAQTMRNKILYSVLSVVFVLVIILVFAYFKIRHQKDLLYNKNDQLEKYNEKLENSEEILKEVIDDKNRLFSIIAHDLRNPVAAVTGFTELLSQNFDELDEKSRKEYIEHILQGSKRSMSLLENLLLWARSQMNLIEINKTEVSVSKLIDECSDHLMSSVEKKDLELITEIKDDFVLMVDQEMIKAVIRNLISNAIKFSYSGSKVHIAAYSDKSFKCIEIKDFGTGIRPEKLEVLFSSKNVTTTEGTQNETGSGLGLVISKDYTEQNGGSILVSSAAGEGSVFTICFPV